MTIQELSEIIKSSGTVGAGGAGFPTYAKLSDKAEVILLNCAECEPLLKLHRQLLKLHADEILAAFSLIAETVGAGEGIIGIKSEYRETIEALQGVIGRYPKLRIHELKSAYPMGDEVVLIYEATGKQIRPGGLPIEAGVAVFNVETVYNVSRYLNRGTPVTDKLVSVVGEVEHPVTVRVPLGTPLEEVAAQAGRITTAHPVYLVGGPMMGRMGKSTDPVTKTTNAILILPSEHTLIQRMSAKISIDLKRAASVCCQCQMCTDLCPRHLLGHPIEPHKFMRSAANQDFQNTEVFLNTFFCSSCGTCELYSCPQGLSPRTLITAYKNGLRAKGVRAPRIEEAAAVSGARSFRRVPEERLEARLGLTKYNKPAPLDDTVIPVRKVTVRMSQHIGAPAVPCVAEGDFVRCGQVIGAAAEGLSVPVHASIDGRVLKITGQAVEIQAQ
ncbi:MAG: 4Fe-4S dicluster domain-containing protein [Lachnospiraceae bacterium]|nr:4Fe-4S dicluster domain-containing protein [Lachnospiraceae bacterium]